MAQVMEVHMWHASVLRALSRVDFMPLSGASAGVLELRAQRRRCNNAGD